jgi:hypothetical protein
VRAAQWCSDAWAASSQSGRLIVCSYRTGEDNAADMSDTLTDWGHRVAGTAQALGDDGSVMTQVAWIDR